MNAAVVLESTQKRIFGWQIIQVEGQDITFSVLFRTCLEPCLPTVCESTHYSIWQSVWVGKSKDLLDSVGLYFLFIFNMQWVVPHSLTQPESHVQWRVWSTAYLAAVQ